MIFGPVPTAQAGGAVLAHSIALPDARLKKGRVLSASDLERLAQAGIRDVVVARLEADDVPEDTAAARIAAALAPDPGALELAVSAPFTGRANLYAAVSGVLRVDAAAVAALNALDEALTLATLPDLSRVTPRQMVATVKIIPYAAPARAVAAAEAIAARSPLLRVHGLAHRSASLICTRTPGQKQSVVAKGAQAVTSRIASLGLRLADTAVVPHETAAIAGAIRAATGDMVLILTGSATSDRGDLGPAGLVAAGGRLKRFGMPVDPGNLLFLGALDGRAVIGLPGCARSPKLNGADWVLERLACGLPVGAAEIAAMGVGGLLKEIPSRPTPRTGEGAAQSEDVSHRPRVSAVILAAGSSRRMRGVDKLLETANGQPLLTHVAEQVARSAVEETVVVLPADSPARTGAASGTTLRHIVNPDAAEGMGTSIACGLRAISPQADAAVIVMADMPEITSRHLDRLIAAFDPAEGRSIVRATAEDGTPGHPVLFGRRFFEALRGLGGDRGARDLIAEHPEFLVEVPLPGQAALCDLDTPEAWAAWRGVRPQGD